MPLVMVIYLVQQMHQVCFMLMGASADAQFHAHTDPMCMILQSHWSISCALFPASLVLCINFIEQQQKKKTGSAQCTERLACENLNQRGLHA